MTEMYVGTVARGKCQLQVFLPRTVSQGQGWGWAVGQALGPTEEAAAGRLPAGS